MKQFVKTSRKLKVAVAIATRGRPEIVAGVVLQLKLQTLQADSIFVVGANASDVARVQAEAGNINVVVGRAGLCHQRNDALALIGDHYDCVVFFDDDFVPSRFWIERMVEIFEAHPTLAGMSGSILDDGTTTAGIDFGDAVSLVELKDNSNAPRTPIAESFAFGSNVGCNMAYRVSAIRGLRFDENLPRYAWLEDSDMRGQVQRNGLFAKVTDLWGVHMGQKNGRLSGVMLGYSQVANSLYLAQKGTVPRVYLARVMSKNIAANMLRSFAPEPYVDRRGRLKGNLMALRDLVRGKMSPNRILEM